MKHLLFFFISSYLTPPLLIIGDELLDLELNPKFFELWYIDFSAAIGEMTSTEFELKALLLYRKDFNFLDIFLSYFKIKDCI